MLYLYCGVPTFVLCLLWDFDKIMLKLDIEWNQPPGWMKAGWGCGFVWPICLMFIMANLKDFLENYYTGESNFIQSIWPDGFIDRMVNFPNSI